MDKESKNLCKDNSTRSQRQWMLHHLRTKGRLNTLQARPKLDVMHPGMRACELRRFGLPIDTIGVKQLTTHGCLNRAGQYVLRPKKQISILNLFSTNKKVEK